MFIPVIEPVVAFQLLNVLPVMIFEVVAPVPSVLLKPRIAPVPVTVMFEKLLLR
jgi:hypothetical protein